MMPINPLYMNDARRFRDLSAEQDRVLRSNAVELSSGGVMGDFSSVKDVKQFIDQEVILGSVEKFLSSNQLAKHRLSFMSMQVGNLQDTLGDLKTQISILRGSGYGDIHQFQTWARDKLEYVTSILNSTFNGEYLFSGQATLTPAVMDLTSMPALSSSDPVDYSYYLGTQNQIEFRADERQIIRICATANDEGFAELITGLRMCTQFPASDMESYLLRASDLAESSSTKLKVTRTNVDIEANKLAAVEDRLLEMEKNLQENIKEIGYRSEAEIFQDYCRARMSLSLSHYIATSSLNAVRDLVDRLPI